MAKKETLKIDPKKIKKEDLQSVFSNVLNKLKSKQLMEKIWIECQRCGSVFWVFADELNAIYPKNRIDYKICTSCERQLNSKKQCQII